MLPYVSVLIVTYRQRSILKATLIDLMSQEYPKDRYEIVVLDDGSSDGTIEWLRDVTSACPVPMKVLPGAHQGDYQHSRLFNKCIAASDECADVFLQIEDVRARPDLLRQHAKWHRSAIFTLVSGAIFEADAQTWQYSTCYRSFLSPDGLPVQCDFQAAWAKSLSYRKEVISRIWREPYDRPYDERMSGWGYHEIEFAYRATMAGVKTVYDPSAGVFHQRHTVETERIRGFDRGSLLEEGEQNNITYLCAKHSLEGLRAWAQPAPVDWIFSDSYSTDSY